MVKKYSPTLLICLIYTLSCLPQMVGNMQYPVKVSWRSEVTMPFCWAVKGIVDEVNWVLLPLAALLLSVYPNKINRASFITLLLWCLFNLMAYFYNYKTLGFFASYFWISAAWLLIYYWRSKFTRRLWQILHKP